MAAKRDRIVLVPSRKKKAETNVLTTCFDSASDVDTQIELEQFIAVMGLLDSAFCPKKAKKELKPANGQRPVARIPGTRIKISPVPPVDSKFFQEMTNAGEEGSRRLDFYRILTTSFPFYLPKRYHAMECLALHRNSSAGQYWANAAHFLFCSQVFGYSFHKELFKVSTSPKPDFKKFTQVLENKLLASLQKENLEQCATSSEFLLEPWVLLQLPFQPLLLHQWSVVLLAEALKFQQEICDFYCIPLVKRLHILAVKLIDMCNLMFKTAVDSSFQHFANYIYLECNDFEANVGSEFLATLPETLAVIEFVLSAECRDVVKALKKMAFNPSTKTDSKEWTKESVFDFECYFLSYNAHFWKQSSTVHCMCPSEPSVPRPGDAVDVFKKYKKGATTETEKAGLKKLVEEKIIKAGRLKGESSEVILSALSRGQEVLIPFYRAYVVASELIGVQWPDCGAMMNIFDLSANVKLSEYLADMTFLLFTEVNNTKNKANYFNFDFIVPASMNFRSLSETLNAVKSAERKWSYQNVLKRVKATCFSPDRKLFPDFNEGAENIAGHFQERIRNLVFKMLEKQYLSRRAELKVVYPEQQVVQYLLPCFIAAFVDLYKDPKVSQDKKKEYLQFLHLLVESYETREFSQEVTSIPQGQPQKQPFSLCAQSVYLLITTSKCQNSVKSYFQTLLSGSKLLDSMYKKDSVTVFNFPKDSHSLLRKWNFQRFMLFSRLKECVVNVACFHKQPKSSIAFGIFVKFMVTDSHLVEMDEAFRQAWLFNVDLDKNPRRPLASKKPPPADLLRDYDALNVCKVFGLILFWFFGTLKRDKFKDKVGSSQGPGFPLDPVDSALWAFYKNDKWTLKQQMSTMAHVRGADDLTLATLTFARTNRCYQKVLGLLTEEGKVKMSRPGEITFFPVMHCRWCGLVEAETFRKCPVCAENPDYPDVNYFCSEECEKKALDKQHTEEHATFLIKRCGIY